MGCSDRWGSDSPSAEEIEKSRKECVDKLIAHIRKWAKKRVDDQFGHAGDSLTITLTREERQFHVDMNFRIVESNETGFVRLPRS